MASKGRSIFIKALGMLPHGGCEKTFCLCILLVKQICSDAFLLSLSTPLVSPPVHECAHQCFLGKQDYHLPFTSSICHSKIKTGCREKKLSSTAAFSALKALGQSLEWKDAMSLKFQTYDYFLQQYRYEIATCI